MPITGFGSWLSTMREFRLHWQSVNDALMDEELKLPGDFSLTDFIAHENDVNQAIGNVSIDATNSRNATIMLLAKKEAMKGNIKSFRATIALNLSKTRFAKRAPATPNVSDGEQTYRAATRAMLFAWGEINGAQDIAPFEPPLLLPGGVNITTVALAETALNNQFGAAAAADSQWGNTRATRNMALPPMHERMKQYRMAVPLALPADSPLLATIPRLTPEPGTTPPNVAVTGVWDNQILMARLTWLASTAPHLDKLQVRGCAGGSYKAEDEEVVADLPADATHWEGDWGLTEPGALASFKVYVMTTTGNESAAKAVKIVRPST